MLMRKTPRAFAPMAVAAAAALTWSGTAGAASPPFDARSPQGLIEVLSAMEAKGEIARRADDSVFLNVTTPAYGFGAQFAGCDAQGKACQAVAFSTAAEKKAATLAQINGFNQTSINCRAFQDKVGKAHIAYSALLSSSNTRDDIKMHVGAWQGCVASFGDFLTDPNGYLARAP